MEWISIRAVFTVAGLVYVAIVERLSAGNEEKPGTKERLGFTPPSKAPVLAKDESQEILVRKIRSCQ